MIDMSETKFEDKCKLKIFTWNINGIRSFTDFEDVLQNTDADIICIQETKVLHFLLQFIIDKEICVPR